MKFDIIVIGSVPGGYVAAIRAVQLGLKAPSWSASPSAESASIGLYSDKGVSACRIWRGTQEELIHAVFPCPHALRNDACGRPRPGDSQTALRKMRSLQTWGAKVSSSRVAAEEPQNDEAHAQGQKSS
jgi:hypothetical protein